MTTIRAENLTYYFPSTKSDSKGVLAVDHLNLEIPEGTTLVLLGPSGCGKTTLLRMLAGLQAPTEGKVTYNNLPLSQIPNARRRIGMVFQNYALIPNWEARRTIGFFLRLRKRENEVPERVRNVSQITGVGIEHLMDKYPRQLSGGEKQRVAIARAFARDLDLLFFDEPFANLDAQFRATARVELRRLLNHFNATSIIVTHDQQEAAALSDRIAVMDNGKIVQVDSYPNLQSCPRNIFVAHFVTTPNMNFFEGKISSGQWQGAVFGDIPVPSHINNGALVTLGVLPNQIEIAPTGIPAQVQTVAQHYAERYQVLDVIARDEVWQIQVPLGENYEKGQQVHCRLMPSVNYLYFDTLSQERIANPDELV
jgi:multiple sugar transport system ATP-binding protein